MFQLHMWQYFQILSYILVICFFWLSVSNNNIILHCLLTHVLQSPLALLPLGDNTVHNLKPSFPQVLYGSDVDRSWHIICCSSQHLCARLYLMTSISSLQYLNEATPLSWQIMTKRSFSTRVSFVFHSPRVYKAFSFICCYFATMFRILFTWYNQGDQM